MAIMKSRTRFAYRVDLLDAAGEILEHLASIEDADLAKATYAAARTRWPRDAVTLRNGGRVVQDSRKP